MPWRLETTRRGYKTYKTAMKEEEIDVVVKIPQQTHSKKDEPPKLLWDLPASTGSSFD